MVAYNLFLLPFLSNKFLFGDPIFKSIFLLLISPLKNLLSDFPGGAVVKNSPAGLPWWRSGKESTCQHRGHGFELRSGKIPHAMEQLSPCATTTEPAL